MSKYFVKPSRYVAILDDSLRREWCSAAIREHNGRSSASTASRRRTGDRDCTYPRFLEYRRAALARAINEFIGSTDSPVAALSIDTILADGETDTVEFKSSARWDYRESRHNKILESVIAKTITGFLNAKGGTLLIGVGDDGKVVGLEPDYKTLAKRPDRDGYQQFLVNLVSDAMGKDQCANLAISFHPVDGKEVCAIRASASARPVYVKDNQQTRFYLRTGNQNRHRETNERTQWWLPNGQHYTPPSPAS